MGAEHGLHGTVLRRASGYGCERRRQPEHQLAHLLEARHAWRVCARRTTRFPARYRRPTLGATVGVLTVISALLCRPSHAATESAPAGERALDLDEGEPGNAQVQAAEQTSTSVKISPPRVDGAYINLTSFGSASFARLIDFRAQSPFGTGGLLLRAGQTVYSWMSLGLTFSGQLGANASQQLRLFALLAEFDFYPIPQRAFSIRIGAGAGGGRATESGREDEPGLFGAAFMAALRYEWFPGADRRRPMRGGGFAIGPELGWLGFTPAGSGQSMVQGVYLGLSIGPYFGH